MCAKEFERVAELVKFLFHNKNVPVTIINWSGFCHLIWEASANTSSTVFHDMKLCTRFGEVLLFHFILVFHAEVKKKAMMVTQDYKEGTLIRFCTKIFVYPFRLLFSESLFERFPELMMLYMILGNTSCQLKMLFSRETGLSRVG